VKPESWLFLRLWFRSPLKIAAWSPTGAVLARAFARHVDPASPYPVLELGGGTGSITAALLETGLSPERLIVLEKMPELCEVLRRRFPGIRVIEGDAGDLGALLCSERVERLSLVVSSLPIIWFPLEAQRAIVDAAFDRMSAGRMLQITNQFASPLPRRKLGLRGRVADFVWRNLPPSSAWVYERA
jgi:phosphatidylethanolamine/phosphatidyl-N-methylethanolamine N-methyltransferase